MLKLYCFPRSGNSREVKITLAEKGLDYESINIREHKDIKSDPEFLKASPNAKVPAIIDGDVYMSNAYEINLYLNKTHTQNPLLPESEEQKAEISAWVAKYDKSLCLQIGLLLIETLLKPKDQQKEETKIKLRANIASSMQELEQQLSNQEYFFQNYSLADISMTPHLSALPRVGLSITDETPNLKLWFERVSARPSFQASASEPAPSS
ncbi:MAG: glutathione S-transferase [Candidatus Omnitrophota bacterium]|jgi:glutathione S-transferase